MIHGRLQDAGGGTFLRFGEAGATFEALDFIGLSHFHTDHSADFPALIKSGNFSDRDRSLSIAGPEGDGAFPGLKGFLQSISCNQCWEKTTALTRTCRLFSMGRPAPPC
jgi:ribonuclease BN (tRNA processing enzyme)